VNSVEIEKSPQHVYFVNCSCNVIDDICYCDVLINLLSGVIKKIENNLKDFCLLDNLIIKIVFLRLIRALIYKLLVKV